MNSGNVEKLAHLQEFPEKYRKCHQYSGAIKGVSPGSVR